MRRGQLRWLELALQIVFSVMMILWVTFGIAAWLWTITHDMTR